MIFNLDYAFLKYILVGLGNTLFTFSIFYFFVEILKIHYLIALTIAAGLGILLTYVFNFVWSFQPEKKLRFQERFGKYLIIYLISYGLNVLFLSLLVDYINLNPFVAQLLLMPFIVIINYYGIRFWALKKLEI